MWGGAVVTTEMAPRNPHRSLHILDGTLKDPSDEGQIVPAARLTSVATQLQSCSKRGWWPSHRNISLASWQHWEKGGDSLFSEQTSTETTALYCKDSKFEYQFIHTLSCLWTIKPAGQDNYLELIPFPILLSNTVILQRQERCRHTALLTVPTGSQQIQQAMVLLMMQSWACFESFKVQEENVTGMFLKDLSYFSTRDWKLQLYCSTDMWTAGKMIRERMVQCKNEDKYKRRS